MAKIWTKAEIGKLLMSNDNAVGRALVVLYNRQTEMEKSIARTVVSNGVGFTNADDFIGTSMAEFYIRHNRLSEKQIGYWRKPNVKGIPRIVKYAGQLLDEANKRVVA